MNQSRAILETFQTSSCVKPTQIHTKESAELSELSVHVFIYMCVCVCEGVFAGYESQGGVLGRGVLRSLIPCEIHHRCSQYYSDRVEMSLGIASPPDRRSFAKFPFFFFYSDFISYHLRSHRKLFRNIVCLKSELMHSV